MRKNGFVFALAVITLFVISSFTVSPQQPAHAAHVTPPPVPADIEVPAGNKAFLVGHAVGTQNYICLPSGPGVAFMLFTPQATLFDDHDKQIITHFFSPNPFELNTNPMVLADGIIRATWQHSRDTSTVWGKVEPGNSSSDAQFRRTGCDCLAPDYGGWSPRGTDRSRQADRDHLHPAAEHLWRGRTVDGLCLISRRR